MKCADCIYLNDKDKKNGVCGAKYYCKKINKYVDGSCCCCESFDKSYCRSNYTKDEIIKDGYNYSDDDTPIGSYIAILIVILVVGSLMSIIDKFTLL